MPWRTSTFAISGCVLARRTASDPLDQPAASDQLRVLTVSPDSRLGTWLTRARVRAALVRPDRVVSATARTPTHLAHLLAAA